MADRAVPGSNAACELVRLDLLLGQDLADRPLGQLAQTWMPGGRSVLPGMGGEQPGGPQLVGRDNPTPWRFDTPAAKAYGVGASVVQRLEA
jgi:hypothetical protein